MRRRTAQVRLIRQIHGDARCWDLTSVMVDFHPGPARTIRRSPPYIPLGEGCGDPEHQHPAGRLECSEDPPLLAHHDVAVAERRVVDRRMIESGPEVAELAKHAERNRPQGNLHEMAEEQRHHHPGHPAWLHARVAPVPVQQRDPQRSLHIHNPLLHRHLLHQPIVRQHVHVDQRRDCHLRFLNPQGPTRHRSGRSAHPGRQHRAATASLPSGDPRQAGMGFPPPDDGGGVHRHRG